VARRYDLVIVGMGSGGMVASEFAASLGLKVATVERGRVGGDCLWTGCVPSKALLASAKVAHHLRTADRWGLPALDPLEIDTSLVWKRIRDTQAQIAATDDNPDRYRALGVEVISGSARVTGPHAVEVDGRTLNTRYILICTGSRPARPEVEGLEKAGYLTSENIFELERAPRSVAAIGGGPIAIEMAQGLRRLGLGVTVLQRGPGILTKDEPELVAMLAERLRDEGVDLQLGVSVERGRMVRRSSTPGRTATRSASLQMSYWSAWVGPRTSTAWASTPSGSRWAAAASTSTTACAPRCRPSTPAATWPGASCSPTRLVTRRCGRCVTCSSLARAG
jgi:pyruvate/2-oxoglutarate dehydrogenase complex dihydrolipoamide dehydrogenase (E3) component